MTASKSAVLAAVNGMVATGDTDIDLGLEWAWRMLSPRWQGYWGGEMNGTGNPTYPVLPLPYNTPNMLKVVILMTDGRPHWSFGNFTAYGSLSDTISNIAFFSNPTYPASWWWCPRTGGSAPCSSGTPDQIAEGDGEAALYDAAAWGICSTLRTNNIMIYTIGYGPNGTGLQDVNSTLLEQCAGQTSNYFYAPSNAALTSAFQQIALQLLNLRISK